MGDIAPFHVMELMKRAHAVEAQGRSVIHMEVGEPDFPTPEPMLAAAQAFLRQGQVHYTAALGLPPLREAIAGYYGERFGVRLPASRVIVTAGASGALLLALGVLVNPGDEWLLPDPGYPCNRHFVRVLEGRPVPVPVFADSDFQPTPEALQKAWTSRTRGCIVASPSNPTGTVLPADRIGELARLVGKLGGTLLVDEIYQGLVYGAEAETVLQHTDQALVINSFSKYFGMTGWRLGWMVIPDGLEREIEKLAQNLFIAPSTPAQHAAMAAFAPATMEILESRRQEFRARRDLLLPGLRSLGFEVAAEPKGAFYVYAGLSDLAQSSFDFASRLIDEAGVALTPGLDFGVNRPERHIRVAYTNGRPQLEEGLERIGRFLGGR